MFRHFMKLKEKTLENKYLKIIEEKGDSKQL